LEKRAGPKRLKKRKKTKTFLKEKGVLNEPIPWARKKNAGANLPREGSEKKENH